MFAVVACLKDWHLSKVISKDAGPDKVKWFPVCFKCRSVEEV